MKTETIILIALGLVFLLYIFRTKENLSMPIVPLNTGCPECMNKCVQNCAKSGEVSRLSCNNICNNICTPGSFCYGENQ